MKVVIFVLLTFLLSINAGASVSKWRCDKVTTVSEKNFIRTCGVAEAKTEAEAKKMAISFSQELFLLACSKNVDCLGDTIHVIPIVQSCAQLNEEKAICYQGREYRFLSTSPRKTTLVEEVADNVKNEVTDLWKNTSVKKLSDEVKQWKRATRWYFATGTKTLFPSGNWANYFSDNLGSFIFSVEREVWKSDKIIHFAGVLYENFSFDTDDSDDSIKSISITYRGQYYFYNDFFIGPALGFVFTDAFYEGVVSTQRSLFNWNSLGFTYGFDLGYHYQAAKDWGIIFSAGPYRTLLFDDHFSQYDGPKEPPNLTEAKTALFLRLGFTWNFF